MTWPPAADRAFDLGERLELVALWCARGVGGEGRGARGERAARGEGAVTLLRAAHHCILARCCRKLRTISGGPGPRCTGNIVGRWSMERGGQVGGGTWSQVKVTLLAYARWWL
jgi:hypothetical protein